MTSFKSFALTNQSILLFRIGYNHKQCKKQDNTLFDHYDGFIRLEIPHNIRFIECLSGSSRPRASNSFSLYRQKPRKYLIKLTARQTCPLFAETCTRVRHGGSRDCPGSKKNNFTRKTTLRHKERNNNGSRTDNAIFNSVNNSGSGLYSTNNQITSRSQAM